MRVDGIASAPTRARGDDAPRVESRRRARARGRRRRVGRADAMTTGTTARAGRGTARETAWTRELMPVSEGVVRRRTGGRGTRTRAVIVADDGEATEGLGDDGEAGHAVVYTFGSEGELLRARANKPRSRVVEEKFPREEVGRLQRITLAGMFASYSAAYFVRKPLSVVKAPVKDALGFTTGTMGLIDSAFLLTYALGQFVMPALGDRVGAKNVIVVGGVVSCACCCMFGLVSAPYVLMAFWALNGLAQAASYPLHVKLLNPWYAARERGTAMGIWATSQQVGATAATVLTAYLLGSCGWKLSIAIPALFTLFAAGLLAFMNLDPPWLQTTTYKEEALQKTKKRADVEPASKHVSFMEILAIPRLKMLMLSYFCVKIVRYCLLFWLPYFLSQEYKMSVAVAGYMSCIYDLGGVLGGLACGIIGDKYFVGKRTMLGALSCALLTFAIGGYQLACSMGMLANAIVMGLIGFLVAGPDAMLGSTAVADCCEQAGYGQEVLGTAAGIVNGMGSIGAVLQGALTALIAEKYGWGALFVTLAMLSALSIVTMLASTNPQFVEPEEKEDDGAVAFA